MALNDLELLHLYDSYNSLREEAKKPNKKNLVEISMFEFYKNIKGCEMPYNSATMILVRNFFDSEIQRLKIRMIDSYNIKYGTSLEHTEGCFKNVLRYYREVYRAVYLDFLVRDLITVLQSSAFFSDAFLYNNLDFISAIFENLMDNINLDDVPEEEHYISSGEVDRLVKETLSRIDESGRLLMVYESMQDNIIPFDEKNIDDISKKYKVSKEFFNRLGFYYPAENKIFYFRTNTLFDAFSVLHEFGHVVSPVNDVNALSELFSIYFEKYGTIVFKDMGYSEEDIRSCELFRNLNVYEICNDLDFIFTLMCRVFNNEPILSPNDYKVESEFNDEVFSSVSNFIKPDAFTYMNKVIDTEISKLCNYSCANDIINLYPYAIAYFIISEVFKKEHHDLMIKWLEFGTTPEEVFDSIGYTVHGGSSRS